MPRISDLSRSILPFLLIVVAIVSLAGCGGGGGGGGGNPVSPTPSLPDTPLVPLTVAELSSAGKTVEKSFSQGALALQLPTPAQSEKFAVLLMNNGADITIKVNGGGSAGLADIRASEATIQPTHLPLCGTPFLRSRLLSASRASVRANIAPSVRSLTSAEQLDQTVSFRVYSGGVDTLLSPTGYTTRNGVLRKIGSHCKLFVDPDEYGGLNATIGPYAISDEVLNKIRDNFDNHIYPLMSDYYGLSYDIDGDGKVAIFLSPLVTANFAGFFDTENFAPSPDSNQRDMVYMWTPDASWYGQEWLDATCETIAHEYQHLGNFCWRMENQKAALMSQYGDITEREDGRYWFDHVVNEEVWLDEALSMGAEIRYRLTVGSPATEKRFEYYRDYVSKTTLTTFSNKLWEYGCVGLFAHYLYEQGGPARIKSLVTSGLQGVANINAAFGNHSNPALQNFSSIENNWKKAVFAELNRNRLAGGAWNAIPEYQKYTADFDIDVTSVAHSYGSGFQGSIRAGAMSMFVIEPSSDYAADASALYMQAVGASGQQTDASIACTVLRLN